MALGAPPRFQESTRCEVCYCSFNAFKRRHHCRCCGRTLCHDHSSNQMALPQFGVYSHVRVCSECFNNNPSSAGDNQQNTSAKKTTVEASPQSSVNGTEVSGDAELKAESIPANDRPLLECRCGMPLCICEKPNSSMVISLSKPTDKVVSASQPITRPKRRDPSQKNQASSSDTKNCSFFNHGKVMGSEFMEKEYEANGEGLREAIKNGDTYGVKKLLSKGVDANYCDKQGLSLLHLAALFSHTDITFILMDSGADLKCTNSQGEKPLDCAPPTLQFKMLKKMEGTTPCSEPFKN